MHTVSVTLGINKDVSSPLLPSFHDSVFRWGMLAVYSSVQTVAGPITNIENPISLRLNMNIFVTFQNDMLKYFVNCHLHSDYVILIV